MDATRASVAAAAVDGPRVRLYGRAGSFGALEQRRTTPSGDSLAVTPIRGWGLMPGQAAYFPAVAPDGTVVIANQPQTDDQLRPTARQMVLSTFQPTTGRFANVIVPTSTGRTTLGGPWASPSLLVGGGDISDVGVVRIGNRSRIAFTSAMPFWGWRAARGGEFPTLGYLRATRGGTWTLDRLASRTASQLAARAESQARAARRTARATRGGSRSRQIARRAAREVGRACVTRSYPATGSFGDCRMPAEFAQLPASGALAVTQYAFDEPTRRSGRLSVLSVSGEVLASYPYPDITLRDGTTLAVHPREILSDPLGRAGDERFTVIFDVERGVGRAGEPSVPGTLQEFRFDERAGTITPTSAPVLSGAVWGGVPLGFETASYDASGALWVGQSVVGTQQAGPLAVYHRPAGGAGVLGARADCRVGGEWRGQAWGRACPPDHLIAEAAPLGIARSLNEDASTRTMLLTTMSGRVLPVSTGEDGRPLAGRPIDLALDELVDRTILRIGPRKAAIDPARRSLWVPIQQLHGSATCPDWPCAPQALDQWLVEVDLRELSAPLRPLRARR